MLNLKEELNEYIDDGSINYKKLKETIHYFIGVKSKDMKLSMKQDSKKQFLANISDISQISFQFVDKKKNTRQRLVVKGIRETGGGIFVDELTVEPIVSVASQTVFEDEVPFWIDNEWYRKDEKVFRFLGKKSYDVTSSDNCLYQLKNVDTKEIIDVDLKFRNEYERVEPVENNGTITYISKKENEIC